MYDMCESNVVESDSSIRLPCICNKPTLFTFMHAYKTRSVQFSPRRLPIDADLNRSAEHSEIMLTNFQESKYINPTINPTSLPHQTNAPPTPLKVIRPHLSVIVTE